jgi:hypothetical protein
LREEAAEPESSPGGAIAYPPSAPQGRRIRTQVQGQRKADESETQPVVDDGQADGDDEQQERE